MYFEADGLFEHRQRYDVDCGTSSVCSITFSLATEQKAPIFLYYEINNFYQNHRRYFKSKSPTQLRDGEIKTLGDIEACDPVKINSDITFRTKALDGTTNLIAGEPAFPCGAMARSYFNDTFTITHTQGGASSAIALSHTGIAWPDDVKNKYKNLKIVAEKNTKQWLDVEDERFMVWMRASATPNFRKVWAKIDSTLAAGTYKVDIINNWHVNVFNGKKYFILAKTNGLGGKNYFLATVYIIMGGLCLIFTFIFIIRKILRPQGILESKLK